MYKIFDLSVAHLAEIADVHMSAFPGRALSDLGSEAVIRYYQWLLDDSHQADRFGLIDENKLVGFCFSGKFNGALNGFLKRNQLFLIWKVLSHPRLLFSDFFRMRIQIALSSLKWVKKSDSVDANSKPKKGSYGILSIAVSSDYQGHGYGYQLLLHAEKLALLKKYEWMNLSVDVDNMQAIQFYERNGWKKITDGVEWLGHMEKSIGKP